MGHLISKIRSYQQPAADLPDHLLMDILSRLPVKDLLRLKSASKTWSALIAEPYFINLHRSRASCIIIGTAKNRKRSFTPPNIFPMTREICILSSTNGLLCVETSNRRYGICNPATTKWLELPSSMHERFNRLKLYTVPSTGVLKVLGTIEGGGGADILTVEGGSTSQWRPVHVTPFEHDQVPWWYISYLFDDGAHWLRCILDDSPHRQSLSKDVWSLDIETEQVVRCKIPSFPAGSILFVAQWDGCLSICCFSGQKMRAWILEDYRINRWRKEEVVLPSMFKDRTEGKSWFVRIIHEGKMWCENGANKFFSLDLKSKRVDTFNFAVRKIKDIVPYVHTLETLEGSQ